jgi:uncharacterized membrane protein YraQ (UPF0718 family)
MMCSAAQRPWPPECAVSVSMGGALAFWMGNPLLNPATLVFMGFVLGWHFAFIRLVAGLLTVLVVATLVQNLVKDNARTASVELDVSEPQGSFFARWGRALWQLFWSTIPVYILAVLVLGRRASGCSRMRMALSITR